jgi:hypothetical protein
MQDVICSTPYHAGNIARREGRCDEVKGTALDDLEIKPDVDEPRDYDHVDRAGAFAARPSTSPQVPSGSVVSANTRCTGLARVSSKEAS